jgi:hypothetical protein
MSQLNFRIQQTIAVPYTAASSPASILAAINVIVNSRSLKPTLSQIASHFISGAATIRAIASDARDTPGVTFMQNGNLLNFTPLALNTTLGYAVVVKNPSGVILATPDGFNYIIDEYIGAVNTNQSLSRLLRPTDMIASGRVSLATATPAIFNLNPIAYDATGSLYKNCLSYAYSMNVPAAVLVSAINFAVQYNQPTIWPSTGSMNTGLVADLSTANYTVFSLQVSISTVYTVDVPSLWLTSTGSLSTDVWVRLSDTFNGAGQILQSTFEGADYRPFNVTEAMLTTGVNSVSSVYCNLPSMVTIPVQTVARAQNSVVCFHDSTPSAWASDNTISVTCQQQPFPTNTLLPPVVTLVSTPGPF